MVSNYQRKKGSNKYKDYDSNKLLDAVKAVKKDKLSFRKAAEKFGVPVTTIKSNLEAIKVRKPGGQTELNEWEEKIIVKAIQACADWGFPFSIIDVRYIVQSYLEATKAKTKFKNNLPGQDWGRLFRKRHPEISQRVAENMKPSRAKVSPEIVEKFYRNLEPLLRDVPASNILNYDESAFVDDPGRERVLVRRGMKYPCLMREHSKVGVSVMMAGTASGDMLPPYIVYKSECLWTTWILNSIHGSRFNRTKSGWFDQHTFNDWFFKTALPYLKRLPGKKIMIGDNLASHLSFSVIRACELNDIHYVLLPPNATHLLQPLDVAVFHPLKAAWRNVLQKWRHTNKEAQFKEAFPRLLKETVDSVGMRGRTNMIAGFRATGLYPCSLQAALKRLPSNSEECTPPNTPRASDDHLLALFTKSLTNILEKERFSKKSTSGAERGRKKKIQVSPGKSILGVHFESDHRQQQLDEENIDEPEEGIEPLAETSDLESSFTVPDLPIATTAAPTTADEIIEPVPGTSREEPTARIKRVKTSKSASTESAKMSTAKPHPKKTTCAAAITAGTFVIVGLPYSSGAKKQKACVRNYVAQVNAVKEGAVEVFYMRKNNNRPDEFVFIMPDGVMPDEPEEVSNSNILHVLEAPVKVTRGRYTFLLPIAI